MNDIVKRLRGGVTKWGGVDCAPDAILAAADEIERLRAALLALTIHEEAAAHREGLEPCHEAQEARWLLKGGKR